jgi:protease I
VMFVIAPSKDRVTGWNLGREEKQVPVDIPLKSAKAEDFHALLLPGGRTSATRLSHNDDAIEFVRDFVPASPWPRLGKGLEFFFRLEFCADAG